MSGVRKALMAAAAVDMGRTMTAGTGGFGDYYGYMSSALGSAIGGSAIGSMSDTSLEGGTIEGIFSSVVSPGIFTTYVAVTDTLIVTEIYIDTTLYELSDLVFSTGGYNFFSVVDSTSNLFNSGVTYGIELTLGDAPTVVTAGDQGGGFGAWFTPELSSPGVGSVSPDPFTIPSGGRGEGVLVSGDPNGAFFYASGTSASLTSIIWNGTTYPLTYSGEGGGFELYTFNETTPMVVGNTYTVIVS